MMSTLQGGTDCIMAPPVDFLIHALVPMLQKFGADVSVHCVQRGFYPRGGGIVEAYVNPVHRLRAIDITQRGEIAKLWGVVIANGLPPHVAERIQKSAIHELRREIGRDKPPCQDLNEDSFPVSTVTGQGQGAALILFAETTTGCILTGTAIGEKGLPAEQLALNACGALMDAINAQGCVDEHMQDQVIIFMALAQGRSRVRTGKLSLHTETSIHYTQLLTGVQFTVTPADDVPGTFIIECMGRDFVNKLLRQT
eukprot:TRINITY_DN1587_c0_g1_i4.p1 TRINITY_DN1587_c0_g1~~TRINITY_DN1587_c0_g1_i4.p1  ORF type:complete len:254 (-),score=46.91 TRINITY_DN1587_c0_g1_i4:139-900(-)